MDGVMNVVLTPVNADEPDIGHLISGNDEFFRIETARYGAPSLRKELLRLGVSLLRVKEEAGEDTLAVAGYRVNPANQQQATIGLAITGQDGTDAVVVALMTTLYRVLKISSFVTVLCAGSGLVNVHRSLGFSETGRLRSSRYRDFRYLDEVVLHCDFEHLKVGPCVP